MTLLIAGLLVFLGVHSIAIVAPTIRDGMRVRLGEGAWKGLYSLLALAGLVMIAYGFTMARQTSIVLYTPPHWLRHVALLLMLPVFPLLIAAYLPGKIRAVTKHPMLVAVKFWALAHLLANGLLADVVLFGGFLAWAVLDRISLKRRPQALRPTALGPFNDIIAVVLGLAFYVSFILWAHLRLFGVSPLG